MKEKEVRERGRLVEREVGLGTVQVDKPGEERVPRREVESRYA